VDERTGAERLVRWALLDPIGWLALQLAELFAIGALVRAFSSALGISLSTGATWAVFAVVVLAVAVVNYVVRRRYVAAHPESASEGDPPRG
jgi:hypothetical protein